MEKEFKISIGRFLVRSYQSDLDIFFWKNGNDDEFDNAFTIFADSCHDFTTKENIEDFINNYEYAQPLTQEDKNKIADELHNFIYQWSSEINN